MLPIILETDRLILRTPLPADAQALVGGLSDPDVVRQTGAVPYPYTLADAKTFIASRTEAMSRQESWTFCITEAGAVGGTVSLVRTGDALELGFWLAKPFWGRGLATEAAHALLAWSRKELDRDRFIAGHFTDNPASGRVLEKLGFVYVGRVDMPSRARDGLSPSCQYVLNASAETALERSHCGHH